MRTFKIGRLYKITSRDDSYIFVEKSTNSGSVLGNVIRNCTVYKVLLSKVIYNNEIKELKQIRL